MTEQPERRDSPEWQASLGPQSSKVWLAPLVASGAVRQSTRNIPLPKGDGSGRLPHEASSANDGSHYFPLASSCPSALGGNESLQPPLCAIIKCEPRQGT